MIKLRLKFDVADTKSAPTETEIIDGENLLQAVQRVTSEVPKNGFRDDEIFSVYLNGNEIVPEFWPQIILRQTDGVIIHIKIRSGDTGQFFKQLMLIAVAAVASTILAPALGLAGFGAAVFTGVTTMVGSLVLNALIPPPNPEGLSTGNAIQESQMYSFSGQSNQAKRLQIVPKVYGQHRMFPTVAANPYTELEVDPVTGKLVQYLYAIYDFGLGPVKVSDIKIGDTPLSSSNFTDFVYRLVDFNKPETSEGPWDDVLEENLLYYKGDSEAVSVTTGINGNSSAGDPPSLYEAQRFTSENVDGVPQEIVLNFTNPLGLYGFNSQGVRDYRRIDLNIYFSKITETNWRAYNDYNHVSSFASVGGDLEYINNTLEIMAAPTQDADTYYEIFQYEYLRRPQAGGLWYGIAPGNTNYAVVRNLCPKRGQNKIVVKKKAGVNLVNGNSVTFVVQGTGGHGTGMPTQNYFLGTITNITNYTDANYSVLTLDRNIDMILGHTRYLRSKTQPGSNTIHETGSWYFISNLLFLVNIQTYTIARARIQRNDTNPVYSSFRFTPKEPGQYKVMVRRVSTSGPYATTVADDLTWTSMVTRFDRSPIVTDKRHTFMEIRMKATSQLNGTISDLSAICESPLEVYDANTETWTRQITRNPAWVFVDLLIGAVNKKAIAKTRLDMDSIVEWAEYCDAVPVSEDFDFIYPRFESNFVLDYQATLQTVLNQVASAAQASLNIVNGKYGVLIDRLRTTPVQVFTPRNSRDFASARVYSGRPHGLKVQYIEPDQSWEVREVIAYDAGYNADNATEIETITSFGCTSYEQAWRFGRYMIAQNRLRQETISLNVDFEHLVCTRGDYVQIVQDVMRVGGKAARVKTVDGTTITTDDAFEFIDGEDYGYIFRGADGVSTSAALTAVNAREFELEGDVPAVGDLIVIGMVEHIVYDCLVKSISPNEDLTANLVLVEKADAVYQYEVTGDIPEYDPQISATLDPDRAPPRAVEGLVIADSGWDCNADRTGYVYFADLLWQAPRGSTVELFEVHVDVDGQGYYFTTRESVYRYVALEADLGKTHTFRVLAVSATGRKLPLVSATPVAVTISEKTSLPTSLDQLSLNASNEIIEITWNPVDDCDISNYFIKYSPDEGAIWEQGIPLQTVSAKTNLVSVQLRPGRYMIKAVDYLGNESAVMAAANYTDDQDLSEIQSIEDAPTFNGVKDRVRVEDGSLILKIQDEDTGQYYSEGYYYVQGVHNMTGVFVTRLRSLIEASGYSESDNMSNWNSLAEVLALNTVSEADWDVTVQYRHTNTFEPMSSWGNLAAVTSLDSSEWSEWINLTATVATARYFQFRIKLISKKPSVTPAVTSTLIKLLMSQRSEIHSNILSDATEFTEVTYNNPFYGYPMPRPSVQVSIDGGQPGDYVTYDAKANNGAQLRIYDSTDTQVSRRFDLTVTGIGREII